MVSDIPWGAPLGVLHIFPTDVTGQGSGGLMNGGDPSRYNAADPLTLWTIQLCIIMTMAQLLSSILRKFKQPRIIAHILSGIILGPSVFGQIPGFSNHIFPTDSLVCLTLTAKIGLCLFLFIIGLEIDWNIIRRNVRLSVVVSMGGMLPSFAIGCAISAPIYRKFIGSTTDFNYFMMFIAMSYSVTALPVLCRILSTLKLRDTPVGGIVLSAAVANDAISWSLLALAIAFVNSTSNVTALWTFLAFIAYILFLLFPTKWALLRLARKTRSTTRGPTMFYVVVVMLVLWGSAFFMDIVGVNAIFGAFVAGIIVPREGGVSIAFVERLEDIVDTLFLPLYFATSGLNTNLGLLNSRTAWAFLFAIVALDFAGKFTSCTLVTKLLGHSWREATAVGSLMSCKGLLGIIILNVGLSAGILTRQLFSMFVFAALILAFVTTPCVNFIYPPKYHTPASPTCATNVSSTDEFEKAPSASEASVIVVPKSWPTRFTVVLDELNHIPGIMTLIRLVFPPSVEDLYAPATPIPSVNALRLIELSERTSTLMKSSMTDTLIDVDPLTCVFRMFGEQSNIPVSAALSVVPQEEWANTVVEHAQRHSSQLVLVPWIPPPLDPRTDSCETGLSHSRGLTSQLGSLEAFLGLACEDVLASTLRSQFVRGIFDHSKTDVALFVDLGKNKGTTGQQHILLPFFGGPDDRRALELTVGLCANTKISATVIRVGKPQAAFPGPGPAVGERSETESGSLTSVPSDSCSKSQTTDDLVWSRYASPRVNEGAHPQLPSAVSPRVTFGDLSDPSPPHALLQRAKALGEVHPRVLIVVGRSIQGSTQQEVKQFVEGQQASANHEMVRGTLGDVGMAFVMAGMPSGVIVVQAAESGVVAEV